MSSALQTKTVLIHRPGEPNTGGPQGPTPVDPGRGWGGGPDDHNSRRPVGLGMFGMRVALVPVTIAFLVTANVFYLRSQTGVNWNAVPMPTLLWLSTSLILISSLTLERARPTLAVRWLLRTLFLGLGFLASQVLALQQLIAHGLFLRHNPHSSMFFIVTIAHGLHLLGGLVALAVLVFHPSRRVFSVAALYWHFLTGLWVCLFLLLLLWK